MRQPGKLKNNRIWFAINTIGLSAALACLLIVYLYARSELSFDRFHLKSDRIYRVTAEMKYGATTMHPARVSGDWPEKLMEEKPAIESMVRLVPFRNAIVKIGEVNFYSEQAFATDSSFFSVFDFKVLAGNARHALAQPGRVFISRRLAMKYFGSVSILGREISLLHQQAPKPKVYVIDGVMEDFPANSHFHAELLTSFSGDADRSAWAYTYFLLKKGADANKLRNSIQQKWKKDARTKDEAWILYMQKLMDIHLFSHKTREIEKNGDIRSVFLLVSGAFIILLIALINYLNLSRVRFISRIKLMKVKMIHGASRFTLSKEIALESLIVSLLSIMIGLFAAERFGKSMGISVLSSGRLADLIFIALGFIAVIALLSILPLFSSKISTDMKATRMTGGFFQFPLVLQFTLSIIAITGTLVLNRQMNFLNSKHPASQRDNMIVIAENPWEAVQRYGLLKVELLKNPAVTSVTAAMEEPGGDIIDLCRFTMEGVEKKENQAINILTTDSNFFKVMGIKALAGTTDLGFIPSQEWESAAAELSTLRANDSSNKSKIAGLELKVGMVRDKYILNQSALKMLGIKRPEDAIGKRFRLDFFLPELFPEGTVVGVVPDFHYTNMHSAEKPLAIAPKEMFNYCFIVCIDPGQHEKAIQAIAKAWKKINPGFPLQYEFIADSYRKVYAGEYSQTRVLSIFAVISILLASLGVFAIASFNMQCRTKEIGIRKVNGASISEVLILLNRDFILWVTLAFVIATPLAYYAMHKWLENFAYKTGLDWWIFVLSGFLALGIALFTVSWKSWIAASKNPVDALRYE